MNRTELAIAGMTCASCIARVERALKAVPGVTGAAVNLATERATVQGHASTAALIAAVARAGYEAQPADAGQAQAEAHEAKKDAERTALKRDLAIAAVLALPVRPGEGRLFSLPAAALTEFFTAGLTE